MRFHGCDSVIRLGPFLLILLVIGVVANGVMTPSIIGQDNAVKATALKSEAEGVVMAFFHLAFTGKTEEAAKLALTPEKGLAYATELVELLAEEADQGLGKMKSVHLNAEQNRAFVITNPVTLSEPQPDGKANGVLTMTLVKSKGLKRRGWLIRDIDLESEEDAEEELQRFLKQ